MSFVRLPFILLFWSALFLTLSSCENDVINLENGVDAFLNHLKAQDMVYGYTNAEVLDVKQKKDVLQLTISVEGECLNLIPQMPCRNTLRECTAYILKEENSENLMVKNVKCTDKRPAVPDSMDEELVYEPPTPDSENNGLKKIELSHETVSTEAEEPFVAVRRNQCCGFATDVDTNIEGVDTLVDTALRQVEANKNKRHALIKIVRLQKQVVAGIKYILTMEIAPTTCAKNADLSVACPIEESAETITCQVEFIEKVWISKDKHIISNNCTTTRFYDVPEVPERLDAPKNDRENEINHGSGKPGDLPNISVEGLLDLESQIIPDQTKSSSNQIVQNKVKSQNREDDVLKGIEGMIEPINARDNYNAPPLTNLHKQKIETIPEEPLVKSHYIEDFALPPEEYFHKVEEVEPYKNGLHSSIFYDPGYDYIAPNPEHFDQYSNPIIDINVGLPRQENQFDPFSPEVSNYNPVDHSNIDDLILNVDQDTYKPMYFDDFAGAFPELFMNDAPVPEKPNEAATTPIPEASSPFPESSSKKPEDANAKKADSSEEKSSEESNNAAESKGSSEEKSIKKRDVGNKKDKNDDSSSSSSSSSSSDEEKKDSKDNGKDEVDCPRTSKKSCSNKIKKDDGDNNDDDDDDNNNKINESSSSSSSSSESDDDDNNHKKHKRSLGQLEKISVHEKPLVRDLADYVAATLDYKDEDNHRNVVLQILGAKKLKLEGLYYNLILRLGISHCLEDKHANSDECRQKLFENLTKICKVQVHVDEEYSNPKIVKSQCQNIKKDEFDINRTNFSRYRRQAKAGGIKERPVDDAEALQYLKSSLIQMDSESGHPNKLKVKEVLAVSSQVVAGTLWKIKAIVVLSDCKQDEIKDTEQCGELEGADTRTCNFSIWDRPWLPQKETEIKCDNENELYKYRSKRQIPGGKTEQPKDSAEALKHLKNSLSLLDTETENPNKLKIKEVISVHSQVVSGIYWDIKAKIIISDCKKVDSKEPQECGELSGAEEKICEFNIWDQPWLPQGSKISIKCENESKTHKFRSKRETIPGGKTEHPKNSEQALTHLKNSLSQLDSESGHANKLKIKEVISVRSQVVSGVSWDIKAKIIYSDCKKEDPKDPQECEELSGAEEKLCDFNIWDQPWLPKGTKTEIKCENESKTHKFRSKRETQRLVGAKTEQPKDNEQALKYLKNSISQLDSESGHSNKLKIKEVISVKSQVVSGISWDIKAKVIYSDCKKEDPKDPQECGELSGAEEKICDFNIWDQPWLPKGTKIEIKCENESKTHKFRSKRETQRLVGGRTEQPKDNEQAIKHLKNSLSHLDSESGDSNKWMIKEVISVSSKVVSGISWDIKAKIIMSDCKKDDPKDFEKCKEVSGAEEKICDFNIWEKPWLANATQYKINCENDPKEHLFRSKRELHQLGRPEEQPIDNPKAIGYVTEGLLHLDTISNQLNKYKIKEILSVTKQPVSGQLWKIKAKIVLSDCVKDDARESLDCGELESDEGRICVFQVHDQPWLPHGRESEIRCENEPNVHTYKSKRSIENKYWLPSSENDENISNPEVYEYVQSALEYLDLRSDKDTTYALKEITNIKKKTENNWVISVSILISDCAKGTDARYCEELNLGSKACDISISSLNRSRSRREISIKCEDDDNVYAVKDVSSTNGLTQEEIRTMFSKFINHHNKKYKHKNEYNYRFKVFTSNLRIIDELNKQEQGTGEYGITKFADLTPEEFSCSHGLRRDLVSENDIPFAQAKIPDIDLPVEFDWRSKGAVTEVKDQGQCGSCWAFSVTGNVEGQNAINGGNLQELSEQELVDCDTMDDGCNGGLMDNAYRMIEKLGGLELEQDYPYDARDEKCHFNKNKVRVQLSGAVNISHDETDMAKWLVQNGPISIAINANAMQFYVGGVSHPWKMLCNPKNLDHGVLIVGYGVHKYPLFNKTMPYWIVKNSWGKSWGEQGYYRVYKGDGTCGLNQTPSSAIVAKLE